MTDLIKLLILLDFSKTSSIKDTDYYTIHAKDFIYSISIQLPTTTVILRECNYKTDENDSKVLGDDECIAYLKTIPYFKSKIRKKMIKKLLE